MHSPCKIVAEPSPMQEPNSSLNRNSLPRLLVTLATYNERDNLEPLIRAIHEQAEHADILVIDDNSPDGTGQLADELAAKDCRIHVMHRPGKLGLGTASLAAMRYAMDHNYDFLLNMDADFSHPPRYIPFLLAGMKFNDVMIGSRYVAGGGTENWPLPRRIISQSVNRMVRLLFRMPVRDASGAFRCFRVAKLRETRSIGFVRVDIRFSKRYCTVVTKRAAAWANIRSFSRIAGPEHRRSIARKPFAP